VCVPYNYNNKMKKQSHFVDIFYRVVFSVVSVIVFVGLMMIMVSCYDHDMKTSSQIEYKNIQKIISFNDRYINENEMDIKSNFVTLMFEIDKRENLTIDKFRTKYAAHYYSFKEDIPSLEAIHNILLNINDRLEKLENKN